MCPWEYGAGWSRIAPFCGPWIPFSRHSRMTADCKPRFSEASLVLVVSAMFYPPKNKKCANRSQRTQKRNSDCRQTNLTCKGYPLLSSKWSCIFSKFVSDDKLFEYQSEIIKDLAEKESCVIVGKCADYVLKGKPNVVSIYIEAPRAFCVNRTMENMGVSEEVANATIERTDKFRADYYEYYTHGNYWTNPVNYDMTLNSERVGVQNCVKTIEQYLIIKGLITPDMIHPAGELK